MLPIYNNNNPLNVSKDEITQAKKIISDMIGNLSFFAQRLEEKPNMNDVHTHMGLLESYYEELSKLVDYNSVLTEELDNRYVELRNANREIFRLKELLGKEVTAAGVSSKLREYDNIVRCFYGALGFRYASLEKYTSFGMLWEFHPELQYSPDDGSSGKKELASLFQDHFAIITDENTDWDIYRDTYHAELLDTDQNKARVLNMTKIYFPNSCISEFKSRRNDFGSYSLKFVANISYEDIETLVQLIQK